MVWQPLSFLLITLSISNVECDKEVIHLVVLPLSRFYPCLLCGIPFSDAATSLTPPTPPSPDIAGECVIELQCVLLHMQHHSLSFFLFCSLLCLQTLLKLSTTNWMHNGSSLVPSYMWTTQSRKPLKKIMEATQETVCFTCWASGPPTRQEQAASLEHGRQ